MSRHMQQSHALSELKGPSATWILPCVGLITTSAFGITLTAMNARKWRSSEEMANWVVEERSTIAIAVQIISHILGAIQVQILCYIISSSFRASLLLRAFSLDTVRFIDAVSRPNIAWRARWSFGLSSLLFVAFSLVPAALWSGAITPIVAESHAIRTINIPTFETNNLTAMWEGTNASATRVEGFGGSFDGAVWMNDLGIFTFRLAIESMSGALMGSASRASNTTRPGSSRAKIDQTGYRYFNRSYGVGSAAGLIDIPETISPQWYKFYERGLLSNVTCMRNESSAFDIEALGDQIEFEGNNFQLFTPSGEAANGAKAIPWLSGAFAYQDIFLWYLVYDTSTNKTYISLATAATEDDDGWAFHQFANVQCEVTHKARNFSVFVNTTDRTISTKDEGELDWPYYANTILQQLKDKFWSFSADDTFNGGSGLGHSITLNINQLRMVTNDTSDTTLFKGLEDFLESLYDDGLEMLSATRLIGANATVPVEADVGLPAVKYGNSKYIHAVLAINIFILFVFVAEAVRTRGWKNMSKLELSDIGGVILSSSAGGTVLAEKARITHAEDVGGIRVLLSKSTAAGREAFTLQRDMGDVEEFNSQVPLVRMPSHNSLKNHREPVDTSYSNAY